MPTIIKIGYSEYLVEKPSQAVAAISALAGAIRLESRYIKNKRVYWPNTSREHEVGMMTVAKNQIFASEPPADQELEEDPIITPAPRKVRRLNAPPEGSNS